MTPASRREDLPAPIREQLDLAAHAIPPDDLLGAVVGEVRQTVQTNARWSVPRLLATIGLAGVGLAAVGAVVFVGWGNVGGPPGYARAEQDGFVLEMRVAKTTYAPLEPIDARAMLTYTGVKPITRVFGGGSLVVFSLEDLDGTRDVEGGMTLPCIAYPVTPGVSQTFPFAKSGGYSPDDPNADFISVYLHDPLLRLPAGHWELQVRASFDAGDDCTAHPTELEAAVRITVGEPTNSGTAQATPTDSPTSEPSAVSSIPSQPPAERTSTWRPVAMPSPRAHGPFGGPQGGVAVIPGGGFVDFVVEAPDQVSVYRSTDGAIWHQDGEIRGVGANGISGPIAHKGSTYVVLGVDAGGVNYAAQFNGAAWVSADLRSWVKAPAQEAFGGVTFTGIAANQDRFVAIGQSQGGIAVCWTSPDGLHWAPVHLTDTSPDDIWPTAIDWDSDHFTLVGRQANRALAWTSTDGTHWTADSGLPDSTAVELDGLANGPAWLLTLARSSGTIQVAPDDVRQEMAPWISTDGTRWAGQPASPALFGATVTLVGAPGGYVAAGTLGNSDNAHIWSSFNGVTWVPIAGIDLPPAADVNLLSDGFHLLLVGRSLTANTTFAFTSDGLHP